MSSETDLQRINRSSDSMSIMQGDNKTCMMQPCELPSPDSPTSIPAHQALPSPTAGGHPAFQTCGLSNFPGGLLLPFLAATLLVVDFILFLRLLGILLSCCRRRPIRRFLTHVHVALATNSTVIIVGQTTMWTPSAAHSCLCDSTLLIYPALLHTHSYISI
jgi:hypothetical protein